MITSIQFRACGASAGAVEETLTKASASLDPALFPEHSNGEMVIQRQLTEPPGWTAFEGRLKVFCDVSQHD